MRIIIHIGYPRTGTTFLQRSLVTLQDNVLICSNASQNLDALSIMEYINYIVFTVDPNPELLCVLKDNIGRVFSAKTYDTLLISHEGLIGDATLGCLKLSHNLTLLSCLFPHYEVVVTVRKQPELAESLDTFMLESTIERYLPFYSQSQDNRPLNQLPRYNDYRIPLSFLNYSYLHGVLSSTPGITSVYFLPFEAIKDGSVISVLSRQLDICLSTSPILGTNEMHIQNSRLSTLPLMIWRIHRLLIRLCGVVLGKSFFYRHYQISPLRTIKQYGYKYFFHVWARRLFYLLCTSEPERRLNNMLPKHSFMSDSKKYHWLATYFKDSNSRLSKLFPLLDHYGY
jgi:hypothetical protein